MSDTVKTMIFILFTATLCRAGSKNGWDVGGKVGVEKTGDNAYGVRAAVTAEYRFLTMLTWRSDIGVLVREGTGGTVMDISVPTNLLYYPLMSKRPVDPYTGPGLTYTYIGEGRHELGANVLAGVNFLLVKGKKFGIEGRYTLPIVPQFARGTWELGLTGSWEMKF
jgi:hypothetical protein